MSKLHDIRSKVLSKNGSLTIPSDIRREYNYLGGEAVDIEIEDGKIIVSPHTPRCMFCGSIKDIREIWGRNFCTGCMEIIAKELRPHD